MCVLCTHENVHCVSMQLCAREKASHCTVRAVCTHGHPHMHVMHVQVHECMCTLRTLLNACIYAIHYAYMPTRVHTAAYMHPTYICTYTLMGGHTYGVLTTNGPSMQASKQASKQASIHTSMHKQTHTYMLHSHMDVCTNTCVPS